MLLAKGISSFRRTIVAYWKVSLLILDVWRILPLSPQEFYNLSEVTEARVNSAKGFMSFCTPYETDNWYGRSALARKGTLFQKRP